MVGMNINPCLTRKIWLVHSSKRTRAKKNFETWIWVSNPLTQKIKLEHEKMSNFKPCQRPDTYLFYIFVFLGTCFKKGDVYLLCKFLSIVGRDNFSFWFVIFIADWNRDKSILIIYFLWLSYTKSHSKTNRVNFCIYHCSSWSIRRVQLCLSVIFTL